MIYLLEGHKKDVARAKSGVMIYRVKITSLFLNFHKREQQTAS